MSEKKPPSSFDFYLGTEFLVYETGTAEVELEITRDHLNIGGSVHGGIISSLCDIALSAAATSLFIDGAERVVTMNMSVSFLKPGKLGEKLKAYGEVIKKGSTILYIEGGVLNSKGDLIAKATGNWFVKK
jgi:acyl-CoA thioesterase